MSFCLPEIICRLFLSIPSTNTWAGKLNEEEKERRRVLSGPIHLVLNRKWRLISRNNPPVDKYTPQDDGWPLRTTSKCNKEMCYCWANKFYFIDASLYNKDSNTQADRAKDGEGRRPDKSVPLMDEELSCKNTSALSLWARIS